MIKNRLKWYQKKKRNQTTKKHTIEEIMLEFTLSASVSLLSVIFVSRYFARDCRQTRCDRFCCYCCRWCCCKTRQRFLSSLIVLGLFCECVFVVICLSVELLLLLLHCVYCSTTVILCVTADSVFSVSGFLCSHLHCVMSNWCSSIFSRRPR